MCAIPRAPTPAVSPHTRGSAEDTYVRRPSNARKKRRPAEVIHIGRHVNDLRLSLNMAVESQVERLKTRGGFRVWEGLGG